MAAVIQPRHHLSQPIGLAGVDWSNPLTKNLIVLADAGAQVECVTQTKLIPFGVTNKTVTGNGRATQVVTGSQSHGLKTGHSISTFSGDKTIFCLVLDFGFSVGTLYRYLCGAYAGGATGFGLISQHSTIISRWGVFNGSMPSSGEQLPSGLQFLIGVQSGNFVRMFRNGNLIAEVASASAASSTAPFCIGSLADTGTFSSPGNFLFGGMSARALSNAEAIALSANPWQLFKAD